MVSLISLIYKIKHYWTYLSIRVVVAMILHTPDQKSDCVHQIGSSHKQFEDPNFYRFGYMHYPLVDGLSDWVVCGPAPLLDIETLDQVAM